ncbi:MAG: CBS domain-containing protein [Planctomycetes bacterium]|nr:CBS domain-containing protein [Planctomycetota bacterium]MCC7398826.1 CBS domain-containing protein [Planctomycetota bacterium]
MGRHDLPSAFSDDQLRAFMKAILADVHALERMLDEDRFESGTRRIGAEQEMFLIDRSGRAWCGADAMMKKLAHPQFTYELAQFNLECNLRPQVFGGKCLSAMEAELTELLAMARTAAHDMGGGIVLAGILPTLRRSDLTLQSMVQNPRFLALNNAISQVRGGEFQFRIKGVDELEMMHDNVMLESCNTSFQVHFQAGPKEFAKLYNVAQAITAPVLSVSTNSPLLLGRRLWRETRVALFQQSVDARSTAHQLRGRRPRVNFGDHWVRDSVLEIFREDIARFRVVLATDLDEEPEAVLDRGGVPAMTALRLHNGTVYRWNRACYGISDGKPHLRIEARAFPAGPTVVDEIANGAFFFGLMAAVSHEFDDVSKLMSFDDAKGNFVAAARLGLQANLTWFHGREYAAQQLVQDVLLPMARQGLQNAKLDEGDIDRYLGVIAERCKRGRTGSRWVLDSLAAMGEKGTKEQRAASLVRAMQVRQTSDAPVHTWELADTGEFEGWKESYVQVGQFMTTDLFTVHPEDVVDLAASLMDWRHIRHVPVEDNEGRLVGLVSHRTLLRLVGQGMRGAERTPVAVKDIMIKNPVTVTPAAATLEAIEKMRTHRIGCLPVVEEDRLVGIITERDLIRVAAMLFEKHLRETTAE